MLLPLSGLVLSTMGASMWGNGYRNTIGFIVDPVFVAVLLTQLLASRQRWLEWMDSGPVVYLGTISYSTYLYHEMAGGLAVLVFGAMPIGALIISGVAATYGIASISYYAVERPFLGLRARIDRRYRAASA